MSFFGVYIYIYNKSVSYSYPIYVYNIMWRFFKEAKPPWRNSGFVLTFGLTTTEPALHSSRLTLPKSSLLHCLLPLHALVLDTWRTRHLWVRNFPRRTELLGDGNDAETNRGDEKSSDEAWNNLGERKTTSFLTQGTACNALTSLHIDHIRRTSCHGTSLLRGMQFPWPKVDDTLSLCLNRNGSRVDGVNCEHVVTCGLGKLRTLTSSSGYCPGAQEVRGASRLQSVGHLSREVRAKMVEQLNMFPSGSAQNGKQTWPNLC